MHVFSGVWLKDTSDQTIVNIPVNKLRPLYQDEIRPLTRPNAVKVK